MTVKNLLDYLETGNTFGEFLEDFPSVSRKQARAVLEAALGDGNLMNVRAKIEV